MKELSASEALFGFAAWLSAREDITQMSFKHDCAVVAERVSEFCTANNLSEPEDGWPEKLVYPD